MDRHTADEVVACLAGERNVYHYYRDRYSLGLLRHASRRHNQVSVAELKRTQYAPLLQKPRVKAILSGLGKRPLSEFELARHDFDADQDDYLLTLGTWGSAKRYEQHRKQTSRPGYNLVLQLNFSCRHDRVFQRLGRPNLNFNYWGHPASAQRNTLAWARIDLDWASGTALIEEIQSDWVRRVAYLADRLERRLKSGASPADETWLYGLKCPRQTTLDYCRYVLERHQATWPEAMLWAAIAFIRDELGLERIYYHSEQSGSLLKGIKGDLPPRSLYTELPRRFCFEPTSELPEFLSRERGVARVLRGHPGLRVFRLAGEGRANAPRIVH